MTNLPKNSATRLVLRPQEVADMVGVTTMSLYRWEAAMAFPKRFKLVANALPVPYTDLSPLNPTLTQNPPLFGFTLTKEAGPLRGLTCYAGDQGKLQMERLGPRVEVRLARNFSAGRARINCTAPGPDGRWRWLGMLYYVPKQ